MNVESRPETGEKSAQADIQELPNVYILLGYRGERRLAMIERIIKMYGAYRINVASIAEQERVDPCSCYQRALSLFYNLRLNIPDELACKLILKKIADEKGLTFVVEDYPLDFTRSLKSIANILAPTMNIQTVLSPLQMDASLIAGAELATQQEVCKNIKETVKTYMGDLDVDVDFKMTDTFIRAKVKSNKSYEEIVADVRSNYDALRAHTSSFSKN